MRRACFCVVVGIIGCASGPAPAPAADSSAAVGATATLEKSADSGQVDRVGSTDGALAPDGTDDLGFVAQVDGPVAALFVVGVDESGMPTGTFQADTLVGDAESPKELGAKPGNGTSGIGVVEGGKVANAKDGSLPELGPGPHHLTLFIAPSPALTTGTKLRLYVQRPDKSLVGGGTITN